MGLSSPGGTHPPPVLLYGLPSPFGAIGGGKAGSSPPARANHQTRYSVCRDIVFEVDDSTHVVTPGTIRKALHLPEGCTFSTPEELALQELMASLGYEQSLAKFGQLKRAHIRKVVRPLQIPQSVKQILVNADPETYRSVYSDVQPTTTSQTLQQPSEHTTHTTQPSLRTYLKSYLSTSQTAQPSSSAHTVKPSSSIPKRTKTVPQTPQKRRRIVLRDESDSEEQKDSGIGGSKLLKRLRKRTSSETPKESPSSKRYKKQRAKRPVSDDEEAAAKEGDQESLISQEKDSAQATVSPLTLTQEAATEMVNTPYVSPIQKTISPADPGTSAEIDIQNLVVPEILYLKAPTSTNPSTTPVTDVAQTPELSTTPSLHLDDDDQNIGEHQDMAVDQNLDPDQHLEDDAEASITSHTIVLSEDADSESSDAANAGDTGDAAPNADADEAGPSGHAPQQTVLKSELVKKFVIREAPVPWSETPAGQEWTKELNSVTCVPSAKNLAEHLTKADEIVAYIEKTQEKQQSQIDDILKNQSSQQSQLNEIQASVELLVSLLLPADAKKGEKVIKSKCKTDKTLKGKDDEKDDQGKPGMGRGHSQGRSFSSRKAEITSHMTSSNTGKRITSATGKRISSGELLDLDEEMSRQLFLQENPGMDLESLMEEEARFKSEKVKSKSEASGKKKLPKLKGIVIKERTNTEATMTKSQPQIDPRSKGKEKVGEPIKVYVPLVNEEITDEDADLALTSRKVFKTTSDMAQVVQSQEIVVKKGRKQNYGITL
ncbi:hypothetical protein AgCh_022215 [Apium graveolens]